MSVTSFTLIPASLSQSSITGNPVRASGYFRNSGQYTINIEKVLLNEGLLFIEGTLNSQPIEFFNVLDVESIDLSQNISSISFTGNFTWLRARLVRSTNIGTVEVTVEIESYIPDLASSNNNGGGSGISSLNGLNLGSGQGIFANATGTSNVQLNFKSLVSGNGITLAPTSNSIIISSSAPSLSGLADFSGPISNGVVVRTANAVSTTASPTNETIFAYRNGNYTWLTIDQFQVDISLSAYQNGDLIANAITAINIIGEPNLEVSDGILNLSVGGDEYVYFKYTAGSSGNLSLDDVILSQSNYIDVDIIDPINCVVSFTFTNKSRPPSSIALLGQVYATNEFIYNNISPSISTRKVAGGGTANNPTLMTNFVGPITLQLRMVDVGASAGPGQRAHGIVLFKF